MTHHELLFIALVILQIADAALTINALCTGYAKESNKFINFLISKLGRDRALVGVKLVSITGMWLIYAQAPLWILVAGVALYAAAMINNIRVLRTAKKRTD